MPDVVRVNLKVGKPTVRFNPGFYRQAREAYDRGDLAPLIQMQLRAAESGFIAGCLTGRRSGLRRAWTVTSPEGADVPEDRLAWHRRALTRIGVHTLSRAVLGAKLHRYQVLDFDYEVAGQLVEPTRLNRYGHQYFAYDLKGDRRLKLKGKGKELLELPPEALVAEYDEDPLMLAVLPEFILMDFGKEAWASFMEDFGKGIIIGKYPAGADDEYKAEVDAAVQAVGESSRGSAPETSTWEIHEAKRNTGDHAGFVLDAKRDISIALLGHANAVQQSSGTQIGENTAALETRRELSDEDCEFVEPYVNRVLATWHRLNWGDGAPPVFELEKQKPRTVREMTDAVDLAYRHGCRVHVSNYSRLGVRVDESVEYVQKLSLIHI